MSNDPKQGDGQPTKPELPPYERIMQERERAKAEAAQKKASAPQEPAAEVRQAEKDPWATREMPVQRPQSEKKPRPQTLAEAAAERAAARQKAAAQAESARREEQKSADAEQHQTPPSDTDNRRARRAAKTAAQPPQQPKRPARAKKRRRRFPWVAVVMLVCVAVVALACVQFGRDWLLPANASETATVDFEIPSGTPVSTMGDMLEEEGLIRSSTAFSLCVRVEGAAANLQAGVHELSPSMTLKEIVDALQEGAEEAGLVKVTVNEGLTVDQIADVVAANTSYSAQDFLDLMNDQDFLAQLVQEYPILSDSYNNPNVRYVLEGYLFPATYDFASGETLESLVTQMVDKTNDVLAKYQTEIDASSYSLQDIMSIASLVEKEGQTTKDRKLIAGVFYNRLDQGMAIQSDISVLYALGTHKEMVTYEDLEVDSPYNLYLNTGLPPGPLNSPSEDAIAAALEPTDSDYLYFYANIDTGEVFYTDDYEQHLKWQQEYEETGDIQG